MHKQTRAPIFIRQALLCLFFSMSACASDAQTEEHASGKGKKPRKFRCQSSYPSLLVLRHNIIWV